MGRNKAYLLLGIIIVAAFFRFWQLDTTPPGLYPDEAMNGINALQAINNVDFKVFYPENNGREGLFINLQALSVQIFGTTPWALRAVSAAVGTLTVLFFFFMMQELLALIRPHLHAHTKLFSYFKNEYFSYIAAFLLATTAWHVHFSRIGFRAIMVSFFLSLAILFLLRGIRTTKLNHYIYSGIFWGLGFYTYIGFRLAPVLGLAIFIIHVLIWRHQKHGSFVKFLTPYIALGIAVIITMLPLLGYFAGHRDDFGARSGGISVFAAENPVLAFLESTAKTLIMFNIAGDWNWRHNFAGSPQLIYGVGAFFLLGVVLLIKDSAIAFLRKHDPHLFIPKAVVGGWFFATMLPAILTNEGLPHALRSIGMIPPTVIFATIGIVWAWDFWRTATGANMRLASGLLGLVLAAIAVGNWHHYFIVWAHDPNVEGAFRQDLMDMSRVLNAQGLEATKYVIVNEDGVLLDGIPVQSATLRFLTKDDPAIRYMRTPDASTIRVATGESAVIMLTNPDDTGLNEQIQKMFPQAEKLCGDAQYFFIRN